ncbi:NrfD/PsrC family molybdoenzyme membrane anchor subunit [Adlercreutzia sp. ZJ154]|uniref:NrfD/PsrC family molybdoenzyme membrane anchor subunit n=1 Tax=Adlercreutzia sp. ZJ154 TaxID=2709790 RepID=UPI0013EE3DFC|nr:NrfD/PsrC family molybdoenzyme membrane anchor subunit [Adlercreutzia sp. ZJ154]
MLNELTILYLFLGGAGAGSLVVLCILEIVNLRHVSREQNQSSFSPDSFTDENCLEGILKLAWPICFITIVFAVLCLVFDLGRLDRIINIFITPAPSIMSVGAYAIAIALVCAAINSAWRLLGWESAAGAGTLVLSIVGCVSGIVAAVYTGMLLQNMPSIVFWMNPLLPVVFLLSSISSGVALVLLGSVFVNTRDSARKYRVVVWLCRTDMIVVMLETVSIIAYLFIAKSMSASVTSTDALLIGDLAWIFWAGVFLCGLVGPVVMEIIIVKSLSSALVLWVVLFALTGALALRVCFVQAGVYDITQNVSKAFNLPVKSDAAEPDLAVLSFTYNVQLSGRELV